MHGLLHFTSLDSGNQDSANITKRLEFEMMTNDQPQMNDVPNVKILRCARDIGPLLKVCHARVICKNGR